MRRTFVLGGAHTPFIGKLHPAFIWKGHPDFGQKQNPSLCWYIQESARQALSASGCPAGFIDKMFVGNFAGELFSKQGHLGAVVVGADPELAGEPSMRVEGACASGGLAVAAGVDAIRAGADFVLVTGAEVQTTVSAREGADFLARASDYDRQSGLDPFIFHCLSAKRARQVTEKSGATLDDFAKVSVKAYQNANRNPLAHMHTQPLTFDQAQTPSKTNPLFLENADYRPFLRVSDCSQVSDGGSAIILCSEAGLSRLEKRANQVVEIVACVVAASPLSDSPDPMRLSTTEKAAGTAYSLAGWKPNQIEVAEVHDCFSVTEILMYEALGFAAAGQGACLIREGATTIDGKIPVNTGGGLIGFGHPVGATGVKQIFEISRQITGQCGAYQVKQTPRRGLCANMGGDDRTAVVTLLQGMD